MMISSTNRLMFYIWNDYKNGVVKSFDPSEHCIQGILLRIENPRVGSSSLPPGIIQNQTIRPSIKGFEVFISKIFF